MTWPNISPLWQSQRPVESDDDLRARNPMLYLETDDEPTWRDVQLPPLRESPSYVYQGDSETEETVYLIGAAGELNPSDELVVAVETVLAKMHRMADGYGMALEDIETDLENALERYRGRK